MHFIHITTAESVNLSLRSENSMCKLTVQVLFNNISVCTIQTDKPTVWFHEIVRTHVSNSSCIQIYLLMWVWYNDFIVIVMTYYYVHFADNNIMAVMNVRTGIPEDKLSWTIMGILCTMYRYWINLESNDSVGEIWTRIWRHLIICYKQPFFL